MIRNLARLVQLAACVMTGVFIALLFANEPESLAAPQSAPTSQPAAEAAPATSSGAANTSASTNAAGAPSATGAGAAATTAPQPVATTEPIDAAALFKDRCSSCHGPTGQGGVGPRLSGGKVAAKFPDIEQQVALVRAGKGGMPAFGSKISEDEIRAVVRYTRTL